MVDATIAIATAVVITVLIMGFTIVALVKGKGIFLGVKKSRSGSFSFCFTTGSNAIGSVIGATVGAGLALFGLPVAIGALGFTGAGIAAGSIAAKMMSAAAIANGGGVAAGSTVAVLQSIGAAGFSLGTKIGLTAALGSAGAASGACVSE